MMNNSAVTTALRQVDETLQAQSTTFVLPGVRKREILVLFQASVLCLMVVFTIVGFYLVPMLTDNKWAAMAMNIVWISTAGMNAVVYIAFNSRIRQDFKTVIYRMVGKKQTQGPIRVGTTINAIARKTFRHTTNIDGRAWN
uniref:Uncharacterized protein n=1 Tax=Romanomermis culicivorax TaxID=13658 RepID=A0A915K9U5_ROMCU